MSNSVNVTIKGNSTITWGSSTATGLGILVTAGQNHTGDKTTITDEDGNVLTVIYFNDRDECEIEFIMQTSVTLPARGDLINICAVMGALVDDYSKKWERGKEMMISLKATFYKFLVAS